MSRRSSRPLLLLLASLSSAAAASAQVCIVEEAKLAAGDAAPNDFFGSALSLSGDTLLAGAFGHDDLGLVSGAAFVFVRSGASWTQQAELHASDGAAFDRFGGAVALDGETALVGASGVNDVGAAYVFVRSGSSWTEQAKLLPDGIIGDVAFGGSVAVDGDTAVVAAPAEAASGSNSGAVYVFVRSGTSWTKQAKLVPSDGGVDDAFGTSVAIDADTILVGAPFTDDAVIDSGSAYVFVRSGGVWTQQAVLESSDPGVFDQYASTVSLSGDTAVVGAFADDDLGDASGSAYVFRRKGAHWEREAKLLPHDGGAQDQFGCAVSLSADLLAIGARFDDDAGNVAGSAYVFVRGAFGWSEMTKVYSSDISDFHHFGDTVAADRYTLAVGAPRVDAVRGAAYVFVPPAEPGTAYCACAVGPCGNADPDAGCANSTGAGARLVAFGPTLPDEVELVADRLPPSEFGIFFQADDVAMQPFGDGFRCADGGLIFLTALPIESASGGTLRYGPCVGHQTISGATGVVPGSGDVKRYQLWYRDGHGPCATSFNLTNGYEIVW